MSPHTRTGGLFRLARWIAPADMKDWADGMTREIEEIDDERVALEWSAACLLSCVAERLRAVFHILATAARFVLGGYCIVVTGTVAIEIVRLLGEGQTSLWRLGSWGLIGILFGATGPLVALRRRTAAWTLGAATAIVAATFYVNVGSAPPAAAAQELMAAYTMVGAFLLLTGVAFWLTRRPDAELTI